MSIRPYNVLFLCNGNSARSILAEALLNRIGGDRFRGHSAGSRPVGRVNPFAERELRNIGADPATFRSKSWDEFAAPGAPLLDVVITVCDNAAGEACPVWLGQPVTAHWGLPDPAAVKGDDAIRQQAFAYTTARLRTLIGLLMLLPVESLNPRALADRLRGLQHIIPRVGGIAPVRSFGAPRRFEAGLARSFRSVSGRLTLGQACCYTFPFRRRGSRAVKGSRL